MRKLAIFNVIFVSIILPLAAHLRAETPPTGIKPQPLTETEIAQKLDQFCDMVFHDAPLEDVVAFCNLQGVPTYLDWYALDEIGIGTDTPVTFRQHAMKLRDGLDLILRPMDLTWTISKGRLLITTIERDEEQMITKVYDVGHLVELIPVAVWPAAPGQSHGKTVYRPDFDTLIDTIHSTVEPVTWDDYGGPGSLHPFSTRRGRLLVVSQSYRMHEKLAKLLSDLAKKAGSPEVPRRVRHWPRATNLSPTIVRAPKEARGGLPSSIRSSNLRTTGQ